MDGGLTEGLAVTSLLSTVVGGGISAIGQKQSADYQAAVARNNAAAAANMARYDAAAGAAKEQDQDMASKAQIGKIVGAEGASGLDVNSGSQAQVISGSQEIARLNTLRTAGNVQLKTTSDINQSNDYSAEATLDKNKGDYGVASSLIGTAASVGDKWSSFQQKGLLVA